MGRSILVLMFTSLLLAAASSAPASAATRTVTSKPTLESLEPGQAVLYDDKKCPSGMIAKYRKAPKRSSISRTCVHQ